MGARGSALWRRAMLLAMVGIAGSLLGCMAEVAPSPDERTGAAESALDPSDPTAPATDDPALPFPGDTGSPADPTLDPEPQPWQPGTIILTTRKTHQGGLEVEDPEPQPWQPGTTSDNQQTTSAPSTKQH